MKVFSAEAHALIEQMAQARREARDNGPRQSNDHLEAAMVLAMVDRLISLRADQERPSAVDVPLSGDRLPVDPVPPQQPTPLTVTRPELPPVLYAEGDVNAGG